MVCPKEKLHMYLVQQVIAIMVDFMVTVHLVNFGHMLKIPYVMTQMSMEPVHQFILILIWLIVKLL